MRNSTVHTFMILPLALTLAACGSPSKTEKKETPVQGEDPGEEASKGDGGIDLSALEFGPYLAAAPTGVGTKQVSVEYGFLDVREQKDGDKDDIFDYRFKQAAAFAQDSHLPTAAASGCAAAKKLAGTANPAKSVTFSGGATGDKTPANGLAAIAGKDDEVAVSTLEKLTVKVSGYGAKDVEIEAPEMPTAAAIQLAGVVDANVTVNTSVRDLNDTLKDGKDDLLIGDVGTAKNYNMVVVTFYPSADAAEPTPVRCYLPKDGSASLTKAKYAKMLPLRGIIGHFANIAVTTKDDVTFWAAAFAGQGAEDLTVK